MTKQALKTFAKNYGQKDFDQIKFDWNGRHGDLFREANDEFRYKLCETIKNDLEPCPDQLIIDLFTALSLSAKETWSIYNNYHLFANELLERGGVKHFEVYIKGATQSMDTGMASGILNLSAQRIDELLEHIYFTIKGSNNDEALGTYKFMQNRFEWLKKQKEAKI